LLLADGSFSRDFLSTTARLLEDTMQRRRTKQTTPLEDRLAEKAQRLREQARAAPPGPEREELIRKARQTETAAHMNDWLTSSGLQPPT
jgi:hypothetical protein